MRSGLPLCSVLAFLAASTGGCGGVDGVCSGEQSDNVECTIDLCDGETGTYAHFPDDSRCSMGQRCDPTGGCVTGLPGDLSGRATLLGLSDHSGITISAEGTSVTATTAADGSFKLVGVPAGVYTIKYTKDKYVTQTSDGVAVAPNAEQAAPPVTLSHSEQWGTDRTMLSMNNVLFTPNRSHMVEVVNTNFGPTVYANPLDAASLPVALANANGGYVTNSHFVWTANNAVWSRPLDGKTPAVRLGTAAPGGSITVVGTPKAYTVMQKYRYNGTGNYYEYSLWVARTDGSVLPAGTAAWTQPDAAHYLTFVVNNDTTAMFGVADNTGSPPGDPAAVTPIHRLDLATNVDTPINVGMQTNYSSVNSISPDGNYVFGVLQVYNGVYYWDRGFIAPITGTTPSAAPPLAPFYGAAPQYYTAYSDYPNYVYGWTPDSSAVLFSTPQYPLSAGGNAGGELKVWIRTQSGATTLAGASAYPQYGLGSPVVLGTAAIYQDSSKYVRAVSLDKTSPVNVAIDTSGFGMVIPAWTKVDATSAYVVWAQASSAGASTVGKIMSSSIALPLTTATAVQLGGAIPASCLFEGTMSNTTFYLLCAESGFLTAFTKSTSAAAGQTPNVSPGLLPLQQSDRIAFTKTDGFLYSASNDGTFASVKLISNKTDLNTTSINLGNWLIFRDTANQLTRISNTDGSAIDEPLFECDAFANTSASFLPTFDNAMTNLWVPFARCPNEVRQMRAPVANLP